MTRRIAVLVGLVAFAASAEVRAADVDGYKMRLAILPIVQEGPNGSASLSAIFGAITAAASTRGGLRVIKYEEMFIASQEGLVDRVRDCGPDETCIAARLRRFNARFGMVVVIDFELSPPLLSITLLDTDASKKLGEHLGELAKTDEASIVARLDREARALLDAAGFQESGRLVVDVSPPSATVALEGGVAPDPGTAGIFTLPAGDYRVHASAEGWFPGSTNATVKSGEETRVALDLKEEVVWWKSPWLWGAAGVVVVGATTAAIVVATRPQPCFCVRWQGQGCLTCE